MKRGNSYDNTVGILVRMVLTPLGSFDPLESCIELRTAPWEMILLRIVLSGLN